MDFGTLHSGGLSSTGNAFAKGFPHAWPIVTLIVVAVVICVSLLPRLHRRSVSVTVASLALAACLMTDYFADKGKISDVRQTSGIGFTAAYHVGFTWGFYVAAILAGVTLALTLAGFAKD